MRIKRWCFLSSVASFLTAVWGLVFLHQQYVRLKGYFGEKPANYKQVALSPVIKSVTIKQLAEMIKTQHPDKNILILTNDGAVRNQFNFYAYPVIAKTIHHSLDFDPSEYDLIIRYGVGGRNKIELLKGVIDGI